MLSWADSERIHAAAVRAWRGLSPDERPLVRDWLRREVERRRRERIAPALWADRRLAEDGEWFQSTYERVRSMPCSSRSCEGILAGPTGVLCEDCAAAFVRAGVAVTPTSTTSVSTESAVNEQLELPLLEDEAAA